MTISPSCVIFIGGNGTAWSSFDIPCAYMRIGKAGQPGNLTAA